MFVVLGSGVPSVRLGVVGEHRPAAPGVLALRSALARVLAAWRRVFAFRERASARASRAEAASNLPRLARRFEHLGLRLARTPLQRPSDRPQAFADQARAVRTRTAVPPACAASRLPSPGEDPHPVAPPGRNRSGSARPASTIVESILTARARKRVSRRAFVITSRDSSATVSGPSRRASFPPPTRPAPPDRAGSR